jgi:hypothetical protein
MALGIAALLAWAIFWAVSVAANAKFGYTLGSDDLEKRLLAGASIASDFFKAVAPVAFLIALAKRSKWGMFTSGSLGLLALTYSVVACTGFIAAERVSAFDRAKMAVERTKDAREGLDRAKERGAWSVQARPTGVVKAEIEALTKDRVFATTKGCAASQGALEDWCRKFRGLGVELATAEANEQHDAKTETKRENFYRQERAIGDYQVTFWNWLTGVEDQKVLLLMMIMTVLLIETGSAFGLSVALALLAPEGSSLGKAIRLVTANRPPASGPSPSGGGGGTRVQAPFPMAPPPATVHKTTAGPASDLAAAAEQPRFVRTFGLKGGIADLASVIPGLRRVG